MRIALRLTSPAVDFALAPEDEAFRDELRGWLDEYLPPFLASEELADDSSLSGEKSQHRRAAWQRLLNGGRWAAVNWPEEYGGRAATAMQRIIYSEVMAEYRTPGLFNPNGLWQIQPQRGSVQLAGDELLQLPTYKRARMGIGRTYQRVEIFPDMTVRDHLLVAERARRRQGRLWKDLCNRSAPTAEEAHRVAEVLDLVGIQNQADAPVSSLGLGSCRLVELARALVADPVLLLADEPSSGLDIHETQELSQVLQMLQRERGMAVLLVEHDLSMVASVVDRTIVMNLGAVIATGTFDEVMADASVRHAYLGVGA